MRKIFFLPIAILVVLTTSCDPANKYKEEIAEIDSCLTALDEMEDRYNGIEFDSLNMMVKHVLRNEDSIKKYYNPDTLSLDIGTRMNECKGIRKYLKNVDVKKDQFAHEIALSRSQLNNLKNDISNGLLSEEKVTEYLAEEKEAFAVLNQSFDEFYKKQENKKLKYYSSVPIIDDFIVQLKNEAQQE